MSDALLSAFEQFFDGLPWSVRNDLSFMMVILSDENLAIDELAAADDGAARRLFRARTRIGRIGILINAVSICDVYFAMNARKRFDSSRVRKQDTPLDGSANIAAILDRHADQINLIHRAKQQWMELRRATLSPAAIAAALVPPNPTRKRDRRFAASSLTHDKQL